jgi:hypothetical protein
MTETMTEPTALILAGEGYELTIAPEAEARKTQLIEAAKAVTSVTSNDESASAQFVSRKLAGMRIEVEKCRKAVKEPVNRIGKLIDQTAKDFVAAIDAEEKRITRLVGAHAEDVARLKRLKEEEERRAFEEARAAREAAERAAAEAEDARENKASIAEVIAARKAAEAAEAQRRETLAARMDASAEVATTNVADGVRFAWDFEVVSIGQLADERRDLVKIEPKRAEILACLKGAEESGADVVAWAQSIGINAFKKPVVSSR